MALVRISRSVATTEVGTRSSFVPFTHVALNLTWATITYCSCTRTVLFSVVGFVDRPTFFQLAAMPSCLRSLKTSTLSSSYLAWLPGQNLSRDIVSPLKFSLLFEHRTYGGADEPGLWLNCIGAFLFSNSLVLCSERLLQYCFLTATRKTPANYWTNRGKLTKAPQGPVLENVHCSRLILQQRESAHHVHVTDSCL